MIDKALSIIAPHICCGCGQIGHILCPSCKNYYTNETFGRCLVCGRANQSGLCKRHPVSYQKAWCVNWRDDALQILIGAYKFERVRSAYQTLAELLAETIPKLPPDTIVTFIPTATSHIRRRGYDHAKLLARHLAKLKNLEFQAVLERRDQATQHTASRSKRLEQAKAAFIAKKIENRRYLLIDDIYTTGATLEAATSVMKDAGANEIWVAVVAKQPSTNRPTSVKIDRVADTER